MRLTKLEANLNNIQALADNPSLETSELKKKFDEAGLEIKNFLNSTLIPEIENQITSEINNLKSDVKAELLEDSKKKYHIGKIIVETENVNPSIYLGFGTWENIGKGKTLVGVNENDDSMKTSGLEGGEKEHTITREELPDYVLAYKGASWVGGHGGGIAMANYQSEYTQNPWASEQEIRLGGGGKASNNMPPFITVYFWKRIA